MVQAFASEEVAPQAAKHDESGTLNIPLLRKCGELGLLGVTIPEEDGGVGMDATASVIVHHELSKYDPGFALAYLAHALLFVNNFYQSATDAQKEKYLPKVLTGEWIGAMGMSETGAGTDVLGMTTTAVHAPDGSGDYVLSGGKTWITNSTDASCFVVYAKLNSRMTAFLVDRDTDGFSTGTKIDKIGMRGSTMAELFFDDCRVPAGNLLGEEGGGVVHMMRNLEIERLGLAAMSVGIAERCLEIMVDWANQRKAFGRPINEFGQIQRYIGESYAETEAARALTYSIARSVGPGNENRLGTDAAKLFAGPVGKRVADNAMQVMGGMGYCREHPVERLWRDAKLIEIGGGTLEAHQKNITRDLTKRL